MTIDTNTKGINLLDPDFAFEDSADGVIRKHTQHIDDRWLADIKAQRNASTEQREGEFMRVASIPTVVIEKWMREGFDVISDRNITGKDIVKRLKAEGLDAFLTTEKSL